MGKIKTILIFFAIGLFAQTAFADDGFEILSTDQRTEVEVYFSTRISVESASGILQFDKETPNQFTIDGPNYHYSFWSNDSGETIFVEVTGRQIQGTLTREIVMMQMERIRPVISINKPQAFITWPIQEAILFQNHRSYLRTYIRLLHPEVEDIEDTITVVLLDLKNNDLEMAGHALLGNPTWIQMPNGNILPTDEVETILVDIARPIQNLYRSNPGLEEMEILYRIEEPLFYFRGLEGVTAFRNEVLRANQESSHSSENVDYHPRRFIEDLFFRYRNPFFEPAAEIDELTHLYMCNLMEIAIETMYPSLEAAQRRKLMGLFTGGQEVPPQFYTRVTRDGIQRIYVNKDGSGFEEATAFQITDNFEFIVERVYEYLANRDELLFSPDTGIRIPQKEIRILARRWIASIDTALSTSGAHLNPGPIPPRWRGEYKPISEAIEPFGAEVIQVSFGPGSNDDTAAIAPVNCSDIMVGRVANG